MPQRIIRLHSTSESFTLGDLEDLVTNARKTLSRDCVLHFPMDSRLWSDSHGVADVVSISFDPEDETEPAEAFVDIDFS